MGPIGLLNTMLLVDLNKVSCSLFVPGRDVLPVLGQTAVLVAEEGGLGQAGGRDVEGVAPPVAQVSVR